MSIFRFKQFSIAHDKCAHKVGTDGVLLGAWVKAENPKTILDVGTGSGLIALMLAQRFPQSQITGVELDQPSAEQAIENAANSPFTDRVDIIQGDFLEYSFSEKFDLIVSNPPFFKGNTSSGKAERDRARHEQYLPQGKFLEKAASLLSPQGKLAVVLPKEESQQFIGLAQTHALFPTRITKVYGRPGAEDKRWIVRFSKTTKEVIETDFNLRNFDGTFSTTHQNLTRDFYLNL